MHGRRWSPLVGCGVAVDLALLEGLAVAWAPVVAGGRRWSAAALSIAVDLALLEGLAVAWAPVVAGGRPRRCLVVNCSRSRSLRGSGCCVGAGGRRWWPVVAAGRVRRCLIVNCSRSRSLRGSGGCVIAGGRRWSAAALSYCELQ